MRGASSRSQRQPNKRVAADGLSVGPSSLPPRPQLDAEHWAEKRSASDVLVIEHGGVALLGDRFGARGTSGARAAARATCARSGARGTRMLQQHAARSAERWRSAAGAEGAPKARLSDRQQQRAVRPSLLHARPQKAGDSAAAVGKWTAAQHRWSRSRGDRSAPDHFPTATWTIAPSNGTCSLGASSVRVAT